MKTSQSPWYRMKHLQGFTLVELIIAMAIFATLLLLSTINLLNVKQRASLSTSANVFMSDMKQQQLKAMVGDTINASGSRNDFGIHFNTNSYVLFQGSTYNPAATTNVTISLGDNIQFVPRAAIIFLRRSGEVSGGATTITLQDGGSSNQNTISVNAYGVVTTVN